MSLEHPTPREGWLSVLFFSLIASPAFYKHFNDLSLKEGKASDLQSVEAPRALHNKPTLAGRGTDPLLPSPASFTKFGGRLHPSSWWQSGGVMILAPNSKSRHAKSLASAGSQDKAVTSRGGSLAKPKSPKTFEKGVRRKLTVYGNGDGYLGRTTADGTVYTKDAVWFASNDFPLGTMVTVTTPEGKSLTAPVKDRMAKRYTGKRIDATISAWRKLTSRGYGLVRGCRVVKAPDTK